MRSKDIMLAGGDNVLLRLNLYSANIYLTAAIIFIATSPFDAHVLS